MFSYILIGLVFVSLSKSQHYRADYEYNHKTNAFYKLHIDAQPVSYASRVCANEGALLMNLDTDTDTDLDIAQVHGMLKKYPDIGEYVWVVEYNIMLHEDAEEQPIIYYHSSQPIDNRPVPGCVVVTRSGEVKQESCDNNLPFVCKIEKKNMKFNRLCGVYGTIARTNYHHFSNVGSCYRRSDVALIWDDAYADCNAEGAHLVVLNSEAEQQAVWNFIKDMPEILTSGEPWYHFAGFRAEKSTNNDKARIFKTIFNQTLDEAGYNVWTDNEPNNLRNNENCGSISSNDGKLNDVNCERLFPFVCEKKMRGKPIE